MIAMLLVVSAVAFVSLALAAPPRMPLYRFENLLPPMACPTITSLRACDGDRIWRDDNGLAVYENHAWKVYTTADGLAHRAVLSLALDKRTGDVWAEQWRAEPHLRRTHRQLHAVELGAEQRCGLQRLHRRRERVDRHGRWRLPAEPAHESVVAL